MNRKFFYKHVRLLCSSNDSYCHCFIPRRVQYAILHKIRVLSSTEAQAFISQVYQAPCSRKGYAQLTGEGIGEGHEVSLDSTGRREGARVAFNDLHIGPAVLAALLRSNFA